MNKKVSDQKISESDIRAIYHQGEDAVVELVTLLIKRIERLEEHLGKIVGTVVNHPQAMALGSGPKVYGVRVSVKVGVKRPSR
ncbi:hypothetical protein ON05_000455 [Acaryochloris sp. CCMEE 5410]|nr:hypothetical protein ON05_000455 [Acaryochloris sp. CCMEE 5410]